MTRLLRLALLVGLLVAGPAVVAPGLADAPTAARGVGASPTASQRYHWGERLYDFGWVFGQSLTSPPGAGREPDQGRWLDASDGTGRAHIRGGGLELASSPNGIEGGDGDHGTTSATLRDQPARFGRWEIRHRSLPFESADASYRVRIELVPDDPADHACGGRTITVAETNPNGSTVRIGVNAPDGRSWTRSIGGLPQGKDYPRNYGLEVRKGRITWFVNGQVVGTVRNRAAIPKVPMTVRLSLVGDGHREMNSTEALFDWVRGWDLAKGELPPTGPALQAGTFEPDC